MNYQQATEYIFGHTNYEVVPRVPHIMANYDLRRLLELMSCVGNPHLKAKSIHIAGTNGKGSTSAMLASVLTDSGYRTGLYTSPHLHTMRERIMIDGKLIGEQDVASLMTMLQPHIEEVNRKATYGKLTVFELLTALCFIYYATEGVEFQVMEVGLGGRFDATNIIMPEVCVLTSISLDHTEVLGNTLSEIATEKAGIIKSGCVVVLQPQVDEVDRVIEKVCRDKGVKLIRVGRDVIRESLGFDLAQQRLRVKGRLGSYDLTIPLLGQFQLENAASAVAALEVLAEKGYRVSKESVTRGLAQVDWPGRMHIISRKPIIVVDGGHNPGASRRLREALEQYFRPAKALLVIGVSNDKDLVGVVRELAPYFKEVIATRSVNPRAYEPEMIAAEFARYGLKTSIAKDIPSALGQAISMAGEKDLICVTGSLFVVGEAIEYVQKHPGA
ncbi:MAG: folylpolyglutamate synthase/dihydrofolate synthase family protein [Dehalococcoidia bacterium]|nr:folylpolyglutamate synthase/dihydrofolate synthase family protein [Dehalococcoidia bacterium]